MSVTKLRGSVPSPSQWAVTDPASTSLRQGPEEGPALVVERAVVAAVLGLAEELFRCTPLARERHRSKSFRAWLASPGPVGWKTPTGMTWYSPPPSGRPWRCPQAVEHEGGAGRRSAERRPRWTATVTGWRLRSQGSPISDRNGRSGAPAESLRRASASSCATASHVSIVPK